MKKITMLLMSAMIVAISVLLMIGVGVSGAYELQISPSGMVDVSGVSTTFFDVIFDPQGTSLNLGTYTYNIYYDPTELTWNSSQTTTAAPSPLFDGFLGPLNGSTPGFIGNFNAGSFGADASVSTPVTLAHLAFNVETAAYDGSPDVWFDTAQDNKFGFTIDGNGTLMSDMPINSNLPDVGSGTPPVVPEPISSVLFIVGGATLGIRRFAGRKKHIS